EPGWMRDHTRATSNARSTTGAHAPAARTGQSFFQWTAHNQKALHKATGRSTESTGSVDWLRLARSMRSPLGGIAFRTKASPGDTIMERWPFVNFLESHRFRLQEEGEARRAHEKGVERGIPTLNALVQRKSRPRSMAWDSCRSPCSCPAPRRGR